MTTESMASADRACRTTLPVSLPLRNTTESLLLLVVVPWLFPHAGIVEKLVLPPVYWLHGHYLALATWVAGA